MLGNGRPSGTGIGEKGDTDRGLLPLTDQQFRHRRKLHNGFKVLLRHFDPDSRHDRVFHEMRLASGTTSLLFWKLRTQVTRSSGAPTHDVLYAKPIPGRDKPRWYEIGEGWVKDNGDDMNRTIRPLEKGDEQGKSWIRNRVYAGQQGISRFLRPPRIIESRLSGTPSFKAVSLSRIQSSGNAGAVRHGYPRKRR